MIEMVRGRRDTSLVTLDDNPLWYKDAVIYELHVRAFCDGNGDGIGDFPGLTSKLDYLQDLGVTAVWLLPFYPSPLRDDGYDIADYTDIHPDYGTLTDFRIFLREAHKRGLRVITELVINHTSDQHPWFQRAREAAPSGRFRDYYVWSDTPEKYADTRIIFKDFEPSNWAWDPVAKSYYWHRFYSHQPDLNFDNPDVRGAVLGVLDFWLGMGVDGLRLDAVPYLYEREGTSCENLPETHAFLKALRRHVDENHRNRMLLAEANQWPEDAVPYLGDGDECHMAFHFPVMPRLFMALHMEDRYPIIDILEQTPSIPESSQWALFLRNHDELTLEMVTDEDRDYMYKVYATDPRARINLGIRHRLLPLLGNNRRKFELLNSLLFSLPGTPVIYYGDEIGMGDNIYLGDRNGVRTPMQWSADRNAGFSRANPQRLYLPVIIDPEHHYETVNVEAQQHNLGSLLWWMKRMIQLRKRFRCFGYGSIEFLYPENRKILAFIRRCGDELILVIANLSRFVNYAELDLSAYRGMLPVELFGQTNFPLIGELPYFVILGPHAFYWFKLEQPAAEEIGTFAMEEGLPTLQITAGWGEILQDRARPALENALRRYIRTCRWYGARGRLLRDLKLAEVISLPYEPDGAYLVFVQTHYADVEPETYQLLLGFASGDEAARLSQESSASVVAQVQSSGEQLNGVLFEASAVPRFCSWLLDMINRRRRFRGKAGEVLALPSKALRKVGNSTAGLEAVPVRREQSNTSIMYGDRLILKLFRRLQDGINPDLEITRFLTERAAFPSAPALAGSLEYHGGKGEPISLGILQEQIPNEGDAWSYTLDALKQFYEEAMVRPQAVPTVPHAHLAHLIDADVPDGVQEAIGSYFAAAELLGRRTGELHAALASEVKDPAFTPEPLSPFYCRALYQSARNLADKALTLLAKTLGGMPERTRADAQHVLDFRESLLRQFRFIVDTKMTAKRIRCHGDYHLGQVLYTGKDFVIIDFEGEPARPISERRVKRSPLRDVAGMLRSFDYAARFALRSESLRPEDAPALQTWAEFWNRWVGVAFLKGYFAAAGEGFVPRTRDELALLLDFNLLEKAMYELAYEINNRPDWVEVPLQGVLGILGRPRAAPAS